MALPSGDTFITNVLIDLPWLFIFQSSIKPLVWCWRHSRNIQHKYTSLHNIFCSHVYLPVYATMQTSFLTCPAKQNDLEFCYLIHLQTKKKKRRRKWRIMSAYSEANKTATIMILMNHNTTQLCRALWLAQAIIFPPYFLKADETSFTSSVANVYWRYSTWEVVTPSSTLHFTKKHSKQQNNMVYLF